MKLSKIFVLLTTAAIIICGAGKALAQEEPIQQNNSTVATQNDTSTLTPSQTKSYNVSLKFENDKLILDAIKLIDEPVPPQTIKPIVGWRCEVIGIGNTILDSFLFAIPATTCIDTLNKDDSLAGGCVSEAKANFTLAVPYYENGIGINFISPDGTKSLSVNTIGFAKLCGDYICESNENYDTCSQDCRSGVKDDYCDGVADGVCDPDCAVLADKGVNEDSDCKSAMKFASGTVIAWWILGILAVILVVAIFISKKKKTIN